MVENKIKVGQCGFEELGERELRQVEGGVELLVKFGFIKVMVSPGGARTNPRRRRRRNIRRRRCR